MQRYCSSQQRLDEMLQMILPVTHSLAMLPHHPGLQSSDSAVLARTADASRPLLAPLQPRVALANPQRTSGAVARDRAQPLLGWGLFGVLGSLGARVAGVRGGIHLNDHVFFWDSSLPKAILSASGADSLCRLNRVIDSRLQVYLVISLNSSCPSPCNLVPLGPRQ